MRECKYIFLDGEYRTGQATIDIRNHSLNFGTAVFESIAVYNKGKILALQEHTSRLNHSARLLGLKTIAENKVRKYIIDFVKINNINNGYIRLVLYPKKSCLGLNVERCDVGLSIFGWEREENKIQSITLGVSSIQRPMPNQTIPYGKVCGLYAIDTLATNQENSKGYDEALLLNYDGSVCEVAGANIFYIKNGKVYTPYIENTILGITRDIVVEICNTLNITILEKKVILDDLYLADQVFISGTYHELTAIESINGKEIFNNGIDYFTKIKNKFYDITNGNDLKLYKKWITDSIVKKEEKVIKEEVLIRKATLEDENIIGCALSRMLDEIRDTNTNPIIEGWETAFKTIVTNDSLGVILIAEYKDTFLGFISASFHYALHTGGIYANLEELWTDPAYRSYFAGIHLMTAIEEYVAEHGIRRIDLGAASYDYSKHESLYTFYERMGYKNIGPRYKKTIN